jgi:outer membrane cobalamin receptor
VWLAGLSPGRAADAPAPATDATAAAPYAAGIVTLPPFKLDAVEPPWARDTRTANVAVVVPGPDAGASMADALRGYPGLQIDQPGGPGGRSSVYLRGGEENYTVVLLDGVPINNPTDSRGGGFDFGTLDAGAFAAVEIVPGPVSARYGPDALAGVIKLTSDVAGAGPGSLARVEAGNGGQRSAYALAGGRQGPLAAAASVSWSEAGGRDEGNYAWHQAVAGGATWQGRTLEARVSVRYGRQDSAAFPDDSGGRRLAVLRSLEERSGSTTTAAAELLSPEAKDGGVKWRLRSWGAWLHDRDDSPGVAPGVRDPGGVPASREATSLRRGGFSAEGAVDTGDAGTLAVGIDGESEVGRSAAALFYGPFAFPASFSATRDRVGAFAEYTWRPAAGWLVQPSMRVDQQRGYGSRVTPRLGARVPLARDTDLRVNAGTGFKLPSFYAVSNPLVGNPGLRPEKTRTVDLGVERRLPEGLGAVELTGFSSRFRDGIDFDPGPPPRLVNRSEIRSDGAELTLRLRLAGAWTVTAAGTYADVRSEPGGGRLRGRPRTGGALRVEWKPNADLAIEASLVAVGGVLDSSVPTGDVVMPAWRRAGLSGRYEVRRGLALMATVENLFNAQYEEAIGVPSPGLRVRGGLEVHF